MLKSKCRIHFVHPDEGLLQIKAVLYYSIKAKSSLKKVNFLRELFSFYSSGW